MTLALSATGGTALPWWLASIFLLVGLGVRGRGARRGRPDPQRDGQDRSAATGPWRSFDRARRLFVDADGVVVAPLEQVRFQRRTQLTSSSPMLVAVTPDGARTLKRGNPFNGGLGNLEDVLTAAVFATAR